MYSTNTISLSEARKKIFTIADEVQKADTYYVLTENGKAKMVMMSADEFASWLETMEIMADPDLVQEIKQAEKKIAAGKMGEFVSWEKVKKDLGYTLADKPKRRYASSYLKQRGTKKSKKN